MPDLNYVQNYPKDVNAYHYAYISLRTVGGVIRSLFPFNKLLYQVIDEDRGISLYDSNTFSNGWASATGVSAYNKTLNYMTQNGWQHDGEVYSNLKREYLPRYRKPK